MACIDWGFVDRRLAGRLTPLDVYHLDRRAHRLRQLADHRAGVIAATLANVMTDSRRRARPYEPGDFFDLPRSDDATSPSKTPEQMKAILLVMEAVALAKKPAEA